MKNINGLGEIILKNAQISLCLLDGNGLVLYTNPAAQRLLGKKQKGLEGKHIHDIVHATSETNHRREDCPLVKALVNFEPVMRAPDIFYDEQGRGNWMEFSAYPLEENGFKGVLLSFLDASVSIKSNQSLLEHQAKFKAVFDNALYPKLILDSTGEVLEANPAAKRILGNDLENTIFFDCFTVISQKKLKSFWKAFLGSKQREERIEVTMNGSGKNKKKYVFDISATKDIQPNMHFLTLVDITKEYYRQEAQNQFVAVASHELKTPLAVIKAYSELLQRKYKGDAQASQYVNKIQEKVDILTLLINAMVDETKLGAGKLEFNNQKIDFGKFIRELVDELQKAYQRNKLIVKGQIDSTIEVDPVRINQVLSNLVSNASKYSDKGDDIIIHLSDDEENIQIGVEDLGPGISKQEQPHLFKAFYRSKSAIKKRQPGLGLGLFISRQIVQHYGGEMWIESKWGKGSTFFFTLPKR